MMNKNKKGFKLFLIFPVIAFGLGTWQVYRYDWKKGLIQRAKDRMEEDPIELSNSFIKNFKGNTLGDLNKYEFRRVHLNGEVIDDQYVLLGPRSIDGILGYYIISPLQLSDGTRILLNRGWSASTSKSNYKIPHAIEELKLIHEKESSSSSSSSSSSILYRSFNILGVISKSKERGSAFTPTNQPDRGQWYSLDVDAMANQLKTEPLMINTLDESEINSKPSSLPNPQFKRFDTDVESSFHNKHMSYIGTWYTLSASLFFIYFKYMRKLPK
ncbi:hypothetical protein RB653_010488 [Dictyostelium firmibasis]|uniref:SURF1-like protein n=1 Tax=Dictyostelium firmibasis TaxID=79012 RepID=A0AAN7TSY3_9MYCE